jgi:hypothetical protein
MVDGIQGFGGKQKYFARSVDYHCSYDYVSYVAALYVACFLNRDENLLLADAFSYSSYGVIIALRYIVLP